MNDVDVLILAAGLGTRMRSDIPKVLHDFDGKTLISTIVQTVIRSGFRKIFVVVGYKGEMVEEKLKEDFNNVDFVFIKQKLLKGSGRAVYEASVNLKSKYTIILSGDVPLITSKTLKNIYKMCVKQGVDGVVVGCFVKDPKEYGRIIKDEKGFVKKIVESADADKEIKKINEINAGIYIFKTELLKKTLYKLKPKGPKNEYYLTDVVEHINEEGGRVCVYTVDDEIEIAGPNSKKELVELEKKYYYKNALNFLEKGVVIKDVSNVFISGAANIAKDSIIYPQTYIMGKSRIGKNVKIGPFVIISNSVIEDDCIILPFTVITSSRIRKNTTIGPFSHIRPESDIGPKAKIGNFSEVKKSKIGEGSKVPHLSYIGDTKMGRDVNIGAGSITCNYDGFKKHKTIIKDKAFIGSNTNLVAPVVIGRDVLIGAGSTITYDVPDGKLAIARARQVIKEKRIKRQ